MHSPDEPRARRIVLAAAVAAATVLASFGTIAHADDEPVADAPAEAGQSDGVVVAVGPPPVPPVAPPPVPPTTVAVAVAPPPVPPTTVAVAVAPPPVAPATTTPAKQPVAPPPPPQLADVERIADVIVHVTATAHAGLALLDSQL